MNTNDDEVIEFIEQVQKWHENGTTQLRQILDHKDADLKMSGKTIAADSEIAKGVRFGVGLALHFIGELPFSVSRNMGEDEDS